MAAKKRLDWTEIKRRVKVHRERAELAKQKKARQTDKNKH